MSENKNTATTENDKAQEVQLSVQHIAFAAQIIDFASERGAFKGPELSSVGQLRDLFSTFVEQNSTKEDSNGDTSETSK